MHPKISNTDFLTAQFYAWEIRGRGWHTHTTPIRLEPPYIPFERHLLPLNTQTTDDGKRHTLLSTIQSSVARLIDTTSKVEAIHQDDIEDYLQARFPITPHEVGEEEYGCYRELHLGFTEPFQGSVQSMKDFISNLRHIGSPISFEYLADGRKRSLYISVHRDDYERVYAQLNVHFPGVIIKEEKYILEVLLADSKTAQVIDFALSDEFMLPLNIHEGNHTEVLNGLMGALHMVRLGEVGAVQILVSPTTAPWATDIRKAVRDDTGQPFFLDAPEITDLAEEKLRSPLLSVSIRVIGEGNSNIRSLDIIRQITQSLAIFDNPEGNSLIPLDNDNISRKDHINDVITRQTRRAGMILSMDELVSLVHIPQSAIAHRIIFGGVRKTKEAPPNPKDATFLLGSNVHGGQEREVYLDLQARLRHLHIIGATGTGKSNLLLNLIDQDIKAGVGCAVLDPHGDLIDSILSRIPDSQAENVVLVDPSDTEYPIGFNPLSAQSEVEKITLSSDLVSMFQEHATSWGDQMTAVLSHAINAFLESSEGGTLMDLRQFLTNQKFREEFLETVEDDMTLLYWKQDFPMLKRYSLMPLLTRLDTFLRPKIIRNMVAQKDGLNIADIINSGKTLLIKLPQGLIGEDNSYLLGTLFVAKLYQAALSRQNISKDRRNPYFLYMDEFQNFMTPSMKGILSGTRKYGLGLVLAHQDIAQLGTRDAELANSVLSNPATRICFRVGDFDAKKLESGFSFFDSGDLQNLSVGEAICRLGQRDRDCNLVTYEVKSHEDKQVVDKIIEHSRKHYSHPVECQSRHRPPEPPKESEKEAEEKTSSADVVKPQIPEPKSKDFDESVKQFISDHEKRKEKSLHRQLQEKVKKLAESHGYKATIEEQLPNGGRVDVSLLKDGKKFAVEVSVTNTAEYEVRNIQKCLEEGYEKVFLISESDKNLDAIKKLHGTVLQKDERKKIRLLNYRGFYEIFKPTIKKQKPEISRIRGYRVKINRMKKND
ncbi:MAG: type IV secretion system DNA-binding domain-containing protein [Chitinophagales bacterium]